MKINELKDQIANNKIDLVIRYILQKLREFQLTKPACDIKEEQNYFIMQSAAWKTANDGFNRDIINYESFKQEKAKISQALLERLESFPSDFKKWIEKPETKKTIKKKQNKAFKYDLFLSFSSHNLEEAYQVLKILNENHFRVFMSDAELKNHEGGDFGIAINKAIADSEHFIILCTPESMKSNWVQSEYMAFYTTYHVHNRETRKLFVLKGGGFTDNLFDETPLLNTFQQSDSVESILEQLPKQRIIENLHNLNKQLNQQVANLETQLKHLAGSNKQQIKKDDIEQHTNQLQSQIEKLKAEKEALETEYKSQITKLKNELKNKTEFADKLETQIRKLQNTVKKDKSIYNKLEKEKENLKKELQRLKNPPKPKNANFTQKVGNTAFDMIYVKGGSFQMGSKDGNSDENSIHEVTLSDFYIGKFQVTQKLWQEVMGSNPSYFKGENRPVENVSWDDCQEFIEKLNRKTKQKYRLPSEAEWEFAARGGTKSKGFKYAGSDNVDEVAEYEGNNDKETKPVGGKKPNELGIYDMSGNVWEWCQDKWHDSYKDAPADGSAWESGNSSGRVLRGGSWLYDAKICRVAFRSISTPGNRFIYYGFRLVCAAF